jgi:metal-responsive CopG/Arc/MetJ family transcriptional regulator
MSVIKTRQFNVRLPEALYSDLKRQADLNYSSVSQVLRDAAIQYIETKKTKAK